MAWNLEFEGDEQAQQKLMSASYHPQSSQAFKPALGGTSSSPGIYDNFKHVITAAKEVFVLFLTNQGYIFRFETQAFSS